MQKALTFAQAETKNAEAASGELRHQVCLV
jgi:hypothetical protein